MLPIVTIVGRTNVGKSCLLNRLTHKQISIVEDQEGVTRDRISAEVKLEEKTFELIDTGGFGLSKSDVFSSMVETQILIAMEEADLILFVVDGKAGITPLDQQIAKKIREMEKKHLLVVNKIDDSNLESLADEFYALGMEGEPLVFSALHGYGKNGLLAAIEANISWEKFELLPENPEMKLAIVGRQNVGKSTYINALAEEERVIVSPIPGTTRDAVDVRFEMDGRSFIAIDTAGIKKRNDRDSLEFYSFVRAQKAVDRADVVIFMVDVSSDITKADKKLGDMIIKSEKPVVIVVNKWDLAEENISTDDYIRYLNKTMPGLDFPPVVFITAKEGKNKELAIQTARELFEQAQCKLGTGELNRWLQKAYAQRRPSSKGGRMGKIFYATQIGICPPTFCIFVNDKKMFDKQYIRFLQGFFRKNLPFSEIPVRFKFRERTQAETQEK